MKREIENAMMAASVAETMEIGVPATVPNRRPLAPAKSWPLEQNDGDDSAADSEMNSSGAQTPAPSTHVAHVLGRATRRSGTPSGERPQAEGQRRAQPQAMAHAAARA